MKRRWDTRRPRRRGAGELFRAVYGQPPLHLLILLASFALCGYAAAKLLDGDWRGIVTWFVGAAVIHDVVLVPLYGGTDWLLHRVLRTGGGPGPGPAEHPDPSDDPADRPDDHPADRPDPPDRADRPAPDARGTELRLAVLNHVRVPAFLSLLLLLVYWPLISRDSGPTYQAATLLTPGVFLGRWLVITAALFGASAALLCVRLWRRRAHRRSPRPPVVRSHRPPG